MPGNSGKKGEQHGQGCKNTCTLLREALTETEGSARCGDRPHPRHPAPDPGKPKPQTTCQTIAFQQWEDGGKGEKNC